MTLRTATLALSLLFAAPALAQDSHGEHAPQHHNAEADHATDSHEDATASHGDSHDEDGAHDDPAAFYNGDDDNDGTPNWRDSTPYPDSEPRGFWDLFGDAEDSYMVPDILFHALHLFLLVTLLFVAIRRPLGDALKNRALGVRKGLVDAARERDEARQKNEELSARLGKFERELEEMRANSTQEAKRDAERLIERAHTEAARIESAAGRSISEEVRRAKATLREEAVDLAIQLAQSTLAREVQSDDQRRLARQFLETLTNDGDTAHG